MNSTTPAALVLLRDDALLQEVRRVAAVANVTVSVGGHRPMRREWLAASVVVVDDSFSPDSDLPRRDGTIVVASHELELAHWRLAAEIGAKAFALPTDAETLMASLRRDSREQRAGGFVLAVTGGSGGVGASTIAASVALCAAARVRVPTPILVDLDPLGGGSDRRVGREPLSGLRWSGLVVDGGGLDGSALLAATPRVRGRVGRQLAELSVLTVDEHGLGRTSPHALAEVLDCLRLAGAAVVLDVPRGAGELSSVALELADSVAVVVAAGQRQVAAAQATTELLQARNSRCAMVVTHSLPAGFRSSSIGATTRLPVVAQVRNNPRLRTTIERRGLGNSIEGNLRQAATSVLAFAERSQHV